MDQCNKIQDDGTQCSNRSVPGTAFCNEHRERLQFTPRSTTLPPTDQPTTLPQKAIPDKPSTDATQSVIQPATKSKDPQLARLRRDSREVLVAPEAMAWMREEDAGHAASMNNLLRLLSTWSAELDLTASVTVKRHRDGIGHLVYVQPPDPQADDLSHFYDRLAFPTRLCGGELYIGMGQHFVQYRDQDAPFGYDVKDKLGQKHRGIRLLGSDASLAITSRKLTAIKMHDVVMETLPTTRPRTETTNRIFVLAAPQLHKTFSRYFRNHHLHYRLVRVPCGKRKTCMLFEVVATGTRPTIPAFVIAYIQSFPRSVVLSEVFQADRWQVLVEWGCSAPWTWPHTIGVFPEDCVLAFTRHADFPNLCLAPRPGFIDGDALVRLPPKRLKPHRATPLKKSEPPPCRFDIRFQRDNGPAVAPSALLLSHRELQWLRRLLYQLPGSEFSCYQILHGTPHSVLLTTQASIRDLPFGMAMKPVMDSGLYIPSHLKLVPDLPLNLLANALSIDLNKITLITETLRLEADSNDFVPLSALLVSDLNRKPVVLELQKPSQLPDLKWKLPESFETPESSSAAVSLPRVNRPASAPEVTEMATTLQAKAGELQSSHDYLGAALYYVLAGDLAASAELFRQQAEALQDHHLSDNRGDAP